MLFNLCAAAVLGAVALYMTGKTAYKTARRMAWVPAAMALMELALCGALDVAAYPVLTAVLMVCRVTVLGCCLLALKKDAAAIRNRRRRREVCRRVTSEGMLYELNAPAATCRPCA